MPGRAALLLALLSLACQCAPAGGSDADPSNATSGDTALANVTAGGNASNASVSLVSTAASTTTTTTTTSTTTTTTVDPVLLGLSERLKRTLDDTGAMEATLVNLRTKLAGTQQVFSGAMRTLMEEQPRLWQLSQSASMTGRKTVMLSRVAAGLSTNVKTIISKLNVTQAQMADVVASASAAAKTAKQLNSMGEFRARFGGCLDAKDPIRDGAEVQVFTCLKGQKSQQWSVNPQLNFVRLLRGPCLAAPKPAEEGSSVMLWSCNTKLPSQQWVYDEATGLLKSSGGLCLAAADPATKGSTVALRACDTVSRGQLWDVVVGNAGLRMRMDALNDELWTLQDPASNESVDSVETRLTVLENQTNEFEGVLAAKSRQILVRRLRFGGETMRKALRKLGVAAHGELGTGSQDDAAFGSDLGLRD